MKKTFSQTTKENILKQLPKGKCCRKAMLYGCLAFSPRTPEGGIVLEKVPEGIAKIYFRLLNEFLSFPRYKDTVPENVVINRAQLGGFMDNTSAAIEDSFFCCDECKKSFVCGVFINCGNITDPDKDYRLDLVFSEKWNMNLMYEHLCGMGLEPLISHRGGKYVLYYKNSEKIEDLLNCIGAHSSAFEIMNTRIKNEIRNNANRLVNCDSHNIGKATVTGREQASAIQYLEDKGKLGMLSEELRYTAELRLKNPELPLTELALMHEPIISKSGLNHRLRKIIEKAKEEKEKD
ncbi:MAG: DNA-binding protein WhiA [Ruminococcaceae bacterium]|nr:DNA-binding protein WhiA [Oscillospiraceae bacterium]